MLSLETLKTKTSPCRAGTDKEVPPGRRRSPNLTKLQKPLYPKDLRVETHAKPTQAGFCHGSSRLLGFVVPCPGECSGCKEVWAQSSQGRDHHRQYHRHHHEDQGIRMGMICIVDDDEDEDAHANNPSQPDMMAMSVKHCRHYHIIIIILVLRGKSL